MVCLFTIYSLPDFVVLISSEIVRYKTLTIKTFWGWPLPIYLLFIQIHSLHPDLQGLDKLTLHIQTYFMAIPPAIAI